MGRAETCQIKPLTEEEKKAKLAELRQKLAEKRTAQAKVDAKENRENDVSLQSQLALRFSSRQPQNG